MRRFLLPLAVLATATLLLAGCSTDTNPSPSATVVLGPGTSSSPSAASTGAIAFVKNDHVWTVSPDGASPLQLTSGTSLDSMPVWSPDRSTVAYVTDAGGGSRPPTIWFVSAEGSAPQMVYEDSLPGASMVIMSGLAWTPDGKQVTFADTSISGSGAHMTTRVVNVDAGGGGTTVLLQRKDGFGSVLGAMWHLAWSPDGTTLAIAQSGQDAEGGQTWLFTPADGGLKNAGVANASFADWSPDGTQLLLSTFTQSASQIVLAQPDGTVISTPAYGGGWTGAPTAETARFSPDGQQIVYVSSRKGVRSIWLMTVDGADKHKLTSGSEPSWR